MRAARATSSDGAAAIVGGWTDGDLDPSVSEHDSDAVIRLGIRHAVLGRLPSPTASLSPTALEAGPGARFVVTPPPAPTTAQLRDLAAQGVCGVRIAVPGNAEAARTEMESALRYADRIVPFGWHVELALDATAELAPHEWALMRLPVATCISGIAPLVAQGGDEAETSFLLELLRLGRTWIRLPGRVAATDDDGMAAFVRAAAAIRPDRLVWGSGPPAPGRDGGAHVADALATLVRWLPDAALRAAVLGDNPARLYGFVTGAAPA